MKSRFSKSWKRKNKELPSLGLVPFFMLIIIAFGFKIISPEKHDRVPISKLKIELPKGGCFQELSLEEPIIYLNVGYPNYIRWRGCGTSPRLQINDKISVLRDIPFAIMKTNPKWLKPEPDWSYNSKTPIRAVLKADKNMTMGFITDIKHELQKHNWVHFNYIQVKK